jgi:hypothetical protein
MFAEVYSLAHVQDEHVLFLCVSTLQPFDFEFSFSACYSPVTASWLIRNYNSYSQLRLNSTTVAANGLCLAAGTALCAKVSGSFGKGVGRRVDARAHSGGSMVPHSAFGLQETEDGAGPSQAAPASSRSWGAREVGGMRAPAQGRVLDHVVSRTWSTDADLTARQRHKQKVWKLGGSKQGAGVFRHVQMRRKRPQRLCN